MSPGDGVGDGVDVAGGHLGLVLAVVDPVDAVVDAVIASVWLVSVVAGELVFAAIGSEVLAAVSADVPLEAAGLGQPFNHNNWLFGPVLLVLVAAAVCAKAPVAKTKPTAARRLQRNAVCRDVIVPTER